MPSCEVNRTGRRERAHDKAVGVHLITRPLCSDTADSASLARDIRDIDNRRDRDPRDGRLIKIRRARNKGKIRGKKREAASSRERAIIAFRFSMNMRVLLEKQLLEVTFALPSLLFSWSFPAVRPANSCVNEKSNEIIATQLSPSCYPDLD